MKNTSFFTKLQLQAIQLRMDVLSLLEGHQPQQKLVKLNGEAAPDYSMVLNSLSNELEDVFSV